MVGEQARLQMRENQWCHGLLFLLVDLAEPTSSVILFHRTVAARRKGTSASGGGRGKEHIRVYCAIHGDGMGWVSFVSSEHGSSVTTDNCCTTWYHLVPGTRHGQLSK